MSVSECLREPVLSTDYSPHSAESVLMLNHAQNRMQYVVSSKDKLEFELRQLVLQYLAKPHTWLCHVLAPPMVLCLVRALLPWNRWFLLCGTYGTWLLLAGKCVIALNVLPLCLAAQMFGCRYWLLRLECNWSDRAYPAVESSIFMDDLQFLNSA